MVCAILLLVQIIRAHSPQLSTCQKGTRLRKLLAEAPKSLRFSRRPKPRTDIQGLADDALRCNRERTRVNTCSKRGSRISQKRAVAVRDFADQLSLGRIAPTASFVRRRNLIFCAATSKRAPLVAMFQITMNETFDRPRPDGAGFLS
jgi:hypothetical protein